MALVLYFPDSPNYCCYAGLQPIKGHIVDFLNFWDGNWDNNLLSNLEVDRSKTKQCCEASSKNGRSQLQTDEILRDFLHFQSWQHQKRNNPARLPQCSKLRTSKRKQFCEAFFKNGKLSAELTAAYQCVLWFFPRHLSKVLRLPRKSEARSYEVLHLSRKIILANLKVWCSKMQPDRRKPRSQTSDNMDR